MAPAIMLTPVMLLVHLLLWGQRHRLAIRAKSRRGQRAGAAQFLPRLHDIQVIHIMHEAGGDDQVLPPVQVHVHKNRLPGPVASGDPGIGGDFLKRAVTAISEEGRLGNLRPVVNLADGWPRRPCKP